MHGQGCPLFDIVHPAFPLPTTASPILQDALKDGFGEAFVACNMSEPRKFSSVVVLQHLTGRMLFRRPAGDGKRTMSGTAEMKD